jgi:hypothetical protein
MTEESTPYHSPDNRERQGGERRISIALTHSEWIELKIALNNEIDSPKGTLRERQIQDGSYTASRIEGLQQLRTACRLRQQSRLQEID